MFTAMMTGQRVVVREHQAGVAAAVEGHQPHPVRFAAEGSATTIELDADGLVVACPGVAERLG